jgi:two-component system phosphate regulon sensor histidine kinase PhoR
MKIPPFFKGLSPRLVAWHLFLLLVFYAILQLFAAQRVNVSVAFFVALLLSVGLAWFFFKKALYPLKELNEAAKEMSLGNLEREPRIYADNEIGQLADSINDMARQLKGAASQITEARSQSRAILDSMADGVIALNKKGEVLFVNHVVEVVFKIDQAFSYGKNVLGVIRDYEVERLLKKALKTGEHVVEEIKLYYPEPKVFILHATPLKSQGEDQGGLVVLLRDITARKKLEDMRTEFVANVSHELRTPLTSIRGYLETLLDGAVEDPTAARHFLGIMNKETERLTRLVEDLLELSRLESRQVITRWRQVQIKDNIEQVISFFEPRAREKNLTMLTELPSKIPCVKGDPDMLTQVLINLVDNAIKYTPAGGRVVIKVLVHMSAIKVMVEDTGIGIPPESLPRLFERFYRVDKARSRELGGTGVGLAIVKHIIRAHGGQTFIESAVGKGSTFAFTLPVAAQENWDENI